MDALGEFELSHLEPVFEALRRVRTALPAETALIGFCGAPWTIASYMIAGKGTPDQAPARRFAYRYPDAFQKLIDRIVDASIVYLNGRSRPAPKWCRFSIPGRACCRPGNSRPGATSPWSACRGRKSGEQARENHRLSARRP